jgi:glycosyltransferase involved in cell wall biosynthesis
MAGLHRRRRIHVLSLVDGLGATGGGAERIAREIATRLDPARFDSTLCISRVRADDEALENTVVEELVASGVKVIRLDRWSRFDIFRWRRLISCLRRDETAILHAHKFGSNVWASVLGPLSGVPIVIAHEHGWGYEGAPLRRLLDRELVARRCDAFIAGSRFNLQKMLDVERIDPTRTRLEILPNGIPDHAPSGNDVRRELGIASSRPVVGLVGSLTAYKSLDVLVDASAILVREFPDLQVLIAGEGPERRFLEARIAERKLIDTVKLLGTRRDIADVIEAFDVATLCSYSEASPLAVMEYMAAGRPVVGTRVGGIPEMVEHGVHGLLVHPCDPDGLAAAIGELLRLPDRGRSLGANGRERQRQQYSIDAMVNRVQALYEELLEATVGSRRDPVGQPAHARQS